VYVYIYIYKLYIVGITYGKIVKRNGIYIYESGKFENIFILYTGKKNARFVKSFYIFYDRTRRKNIFKKVSQWRF